MADDFVTICAVCSKGITKQDLKYTNGHSFHNQCFAKQGNEYPSIDSALQSNTSRAKIELIQLKNLKERLVGGSKSTKSSKRKTTKKKTATRRKPTRKTARKTTAKRKTTKKKTATRRKPTRKTARKTTAKRKTTKKKTATRRKPTRKTARKTTAKRRTRR